MAHQPTWHASDRGCTVWEHRLASWVADQEPAEKERFFVGRYQEALEALGWVGSRFQLVNEHNQSQYYLVYGSQNSRGRRAFKEAVWSVAVDGEFRFSDLRDTSQTGFAKSVYETMVVDELAEGLTRGFSGSEARVSELEEWTDDHPTALLPHLRQALVRLEDENPSPIAEVRISGRRRRKGTYPSDATVRFHLTGHLPPANPEQPPLC